MCVSTQYLHEIQLNNTDYSTESPFWGCGVGFSKRIAPLGGSDRRSTYHEKREGERGYKIGILIFRHVPMFELSRHNIRILQISQNTIMPSVAMKEMVPVEAC